MKWDQPPLWPVAAPSMMGFIAGCLPYLSESQYLTTETKFSLFAPFGMVAIACLVICGFQNRYEAKIEMFLGALSSLLFSLLPQLLFFVWFVPVILIWVRESIFVWRKSYPAFRIGVWIGLGAASGVYMGGIFAFNVV
ncbi:MAG: hypothetical protein L7R66_01415 [Candidatus Thalassarchaeaceae archaeon]|nr:hypothetical protein [Candidatus Thalassarchaeaceae archaeon]